MSRILITGGAGYIGSVLVPMLLTEGHEVTVVDNFMYAQYNSLSGSCFNSRLKIVNKDAYDFIESTDTLYDFNTIIPLAAIVGMPACNKHPDVTIINEHQLADLVYRLYSHQLVIYPNTNSAYGFSENEITEDFPLHPLSLYAETKLAGENAAKKHSNHIIFRLATAFGESPRHRTDLMVNEFVWKAVTDKSIVLFEPHFRRNFVHVRDIARAFIHAINNQESMRNNVYNVGDTRANMTKRELCDKIQEHIPDFEIFETDSKVDPDKRDYIVSNAKIEATGWTPLYSIDDGIQELIKLYSVYPRHQFGNV